MKEIKYSYNTRSVDEIISLIYRQSENIPFNALSMVFYCLENDPRIAFKIEFELNDDSLVVSWYYKGSFGTRKEDHIYEEFSIDYPIHLTLLLPKVQKDILDSARKWMELQKAVN